MGVSRVRRERAQARTAAAGADLQGSSATQIPFLFTLYYSTLSWNLVRPAQASSSVLNNYIAVVKDSQFWTVALTTVTVLIVVVVSAYQALLGLLLALLSGIAAFLGRGVLRIVC